MYELTEYDVKTKETILRELNEEELKQYKIKEELHKKNEIEKENKKKLDNQNRLDAITHAKSLGFTDQMITIMYPNLGA